MLPWLWLIQPLAWELPYATCVALKRKRKKRERERENRKLSIGFIHKEVFSDIGESEDCVVFDTEADHCGLINKRAVRT